MTVNILDNEDLSNHFNYLDELRDSGVTNMFGASTHLQDEFALDKATANTILGKWMDSYGSKNT